MSAIYLKFMISQYEWHSNSVVIINTIEENLVETKSKETRESFFFIFSWTLKDIPHNLEKKVILSLSFTKKWIFMNPNS